MPNPCIIVHTYPDFFPATKQCSNIHTNLEHCDGSLFRGGCRDDFTRHAECTAYTQHLTGSSYPSTSQYYHQSTHTMIFVCSPPREPPARSVCPTSNNTTPPVSKRAFAASQASFTDSVLQHTYRCLSSDGRPRKSERPAATR